MPALIFLLACTAEGVDSKAPTSADEPPVLEAPPAGEGFQVSMFGTAPAHSEVWLCEVYDLPTDELLNINSVEYLQNANTHHMSLSTTALSTASIEPGTYDCNDLYSDSTVMQDAIIMFGNQGEAEGTLTLPEGVVASLPAQIPIIHEIHYVNAGDEDIELYSYVNGWSIPSEEVVSGIWGGSVRDEDIAIPPNSEHTEWSRCVMNEDVDVLFLASHTHARGSAFTIAPYDGVATGDVFFENTDWHDPLITQYETPIHVPAGQGFEFACTWQNDDDFEVNYGFESTDEMCNMAIVFTPGSMTAECSIVESGVR